MMTEKWVADLVTMTCRNRANRITVRFANAGSCLEGRVADAPMGLLSALARSPGGTACLGRQVAEAEGVFIPAFLKARMEG
jgi:hypothetical protein